MKNNSWKPFWLVQDIPKTNFRPRRFSANSQAGNLPPNPQKFFRKVLAEKNQMEDEMERNNPLKATTLSAELEKLC